MLIEATDGDGRSVLVNTDEIAVVREETRTERVCIILRGADIKINVRESFQEIKKRCGLTITPRAETICKP